MTTKAPPRWIPVGQAVRYRGRWWRLCVYGLHRSTNWSGFVEWADPHTPTTNRWLGRHPNERAARLAALRIIREEAKQCSPSTLT